MTQKRTVAVIMGSTRAGRICPSISEWVVSIGETCTDLRYDIIDLADWPLPMDDEPMLPALGAYAQVHTRAWSEKIRSVAAVVFVTPQYNWGYPAVLKNAIDHLHAEWRDKPVAIVTYGGHGGTKCAAQLLQVAAAVKMRVVEPAPAITLSDDVIQQGAPFKPGSESEAAHQDIRAALAALAAQLH